MTGLVLTDEVVRPELQRRAGRAEYAGRQQPRRAAGRADGRRALSQSSLRPAGDRLAARDRTARPRGGAGVLPALLHAQQRHSRGRRRRDARRGPHARGRDLRQGRPRRRGQAAASPAGAGAAGGAHRDAGRSARHPAELQPLLSRALEHERAAGRERSARPARPYPGPRLEQPALSDAGGRQGHRRERGRELRRHRARQHALAASTQRRSPERACRSSRRRSTPSSPTSSRTA